MKYVIFMNAAGVIEVRLAPAPTTHQQMAAELEPRGFKPTSAGFARFLPEGRFETTGWSQSLGLTPHGDDARYLSAYYTATLSQIPKTT
jgi:hypothetical protein